MSNNTPILVTGAAGNVGSIGRIVVKLLRERDLPVRALVHRLDERSQALSEMGAELVVADLTNGADVEGGEKIVARLQADVFWHEYLAIISSSYGYYSSRSKRNPRFRDSRQHLANDSFADESN